MKKIETFTEFMKLWNINHKNRYWGNKKITKEKEEEIIQHADLSDFKRYDIYVLDENHFIIFDTKYTINNNLYYNDEQDAPEVTLDYFKAKNEVNKKYYKIEDTEKMKPYYIINYDNDEKIKELCVKRDLYYANYLDYLDNLEYYTKKGIFYRFLTDEEISTYNNIVDELDKKYNKRLEDYYKKYNKNIYAVGYWVNR